MTKYDLLASVKTQVLVINEDSVRLNTGPSALAPPHLTASELWPSFQTAPPLECLEMKARLLFKVLSLRRITSRQFSMSLCSLCLVSVSQIYKTTLWHTRCLQTHSRRNISWSLLFNAPAPLRGLRVYGEEQGLSSRLSPIHNEYPAINKRLLWSIPMLSCPTARETLTLTHFTLVC